ncbi:MAG: glycosyltransferase [Candidatus Gottesmanbacteria bacterium]
MNNNKIYVSVIIPCYNEEQNIKTGILDKVYAYLEKQNYSWDVNIVDDGSSDNSVRLVEKFISGHPNFSLIRNPHQGKAATVISGMLQAKGKYVLFSDFDQATPIEEIEKVLPWFDQGFDIIIGSRSSHRKGAPLSRLIIARGFMLLRHLVLGLEGISDTQCGFKAFKNDVANKLFGFLRLYGEKKSVSGPLVTAGFDIELLFLAKKLGFKIKEVPVEWHYVETRRVNPVKDSWYGFWDLILIRLNEIRGLYDKK